MLVAHSFAFLAHAWPDRRVLGSCGLLAATNDALSLLVSGDIIPWHTTKSLAFESNDSYWRMIKLVQVAAVDFELRDVTRADAPHWTVSFANDADSRVRGTMENFKVVASWTYNGDGLPLGTDSTVRDCFVHTNDDAFNLYHGGGSITGCTVWQSENGAVFQLGWFPKAVSDVQITAVTLGNQAAAQLGTAAEALAGQLTEPAMLAATLPCASTGEPACARALIERYGRRLFRRPLTPEEIDRYLALYASVRASSDFGTGARWGLVALMQSPHTVYRSEVGEGVGFAAGEPRTLSPYELASELSYTFAGEPPSDALLAQAERRAVHGTRKKTHRVSIGGGHGRRLGE